MKNIVKFIPLLILILSYQVKSDELLILETRAGITQPVLLWETKNQEPEFLVVFFPSSNGNIGLTSRDGVVGAERFYLLQNLREEFEPSKFAVAIIDTPSDRNGLGESFRQSEEHFVDMKIVLSELKKRFPSSKVILMGHSRGSVSAGHVSRALDSQVDATVLLAARYKESARPVDAPQEAPGGKGLSEINFDKLNKPTLLVHHVNDACPSTLYADAKEKEIYAPLITISGPVDKSPMDTGEFALCAPGTNHWFSGQEKLVGEKIIAWLSEINTVKTM
ncbi:MAG: hypothetical protein ACRCRU_03200 [Vibrio sp.]|uniref:hypothetical protein n=1 Tax=Vibrio sp. TaxID=678 RepID=UPI003F393A12